MISVAKSPGDPSRTKRLHGVLPVPCADCPFRNDGNAIPLRPGRVEGIVRDMIENDFNYFPCHKTLQGRAKQGKECAGASAFLRKAHNRTTMSTRLSITFKMVTPAQLRCAEDMTVNSLEETPKCR